MAAIRVESLSKSFGREALALDGVDLNIEEGELFVVVGPSGCGKSTLLRTLAGLECPTRGDIFFDSQRVTPLGPRQRNIAMVFQSYALYPHKTVFENIAFGLRARGEPKDLVEERVREAATMLGVDGLLERWPRELSGGERQRVAIGRAIVRRPVLFLLDEPLSNLDARLREEMRGELARIQKNLGVTTVLVTHDQIEAMTLGDRVAVIRSGRIQQVDSARGLYDFPKNRFVAEFLGSPPMNFIEGRIRVAGACVGLETAAGSIPLSGKLQKNNYREIPLNSGASAVLGIRPEAVRISPEDGSGIKSRILRIEPLGHEGIIHLGMSSTGVLCRTSRWRRWRPGDTATAEIPLASVHLFRPSDDERIWSGANLTREVSRSEVGP